MRTVHLVNLVLLGALVLGSLAAWPELPASIPAHLGLGGEPTRWTERSLAAWFGLPALAVAMTLLIYGVAWLLPGRPRFLNIPDKQRFLALPPERQAPVLRLVQTSLYWVNAYSLTLQGLVQLSLYRAAHGEADRMFMLFLLLFALAVPPLIVLPLLSRTQAEITRQTRQHREATSER